MSVKVSWYDRGRDAFTEGLPCHIADARISGKDRQAWYAGWHRQAKLNAPEIPEESRQEMLAMLEETRKLLTEQAD